MNNKYLKWVIFGCAIIMALMLLLDWLIVTDDDKIVARLEQLASAANDNDVARFMDALSNECVAHDSHSVITRELLPELFVKYVHRVKDTELAYHQITREGGIASVSARWETVLTPESGLPYPMEVSLWALVTLKKSGDEWHVTEIRLTKIGNSAPPALR